ncbi:MAG: T9SS type A sorting domain-containing protein [candidate division Zixibacteria bacterium]|nr:T9SS type A sorting domain-containing protein [candidate division Zixibacteria bacterium]
MLYLTLVLLFFFPILAFSQWEGAEISRLSYDSCDNGIVNLMEIDENDKIYLIYWQNPKPYTTNVTEFLLTKEKGSDWSAPVEIGNPAFKVTLYCPHLWGIDVKNELIHCIYACGDTLYYTNDTMNWEVIKIDSSAGYATGDNLFSDSLGNVHFSWNYEYFQSGYKYYRVMYMTNATGQWTKQQVSPEIFIGYGSSAISRMAVEKGGRAHIFYYTPDFLYHIVNDTLGGTNWAKDSLSYPFYCWDEVGDFRIGRDNSLHILFIGSDVLSPILDQDFSLWYYYRDSSSTQWNPPEQITDIGRGWWLFLDNQGDPHVNWNNLSQLGASFYANKKKGFWESTQLLDNPYATHWIRFVLDSGGLGYAVFVGTEYAPSRESTEVYYLGPTTGISNPDNPERPLSFELKQNYPNPFNPKTTIPFSLKVQGSRFNEPVHTTLIIYNILGQKVRVLMDEEKVSGDYMVFWDGKDEKGKEVSSGIYFYVLQFNDFKETKKMLLIR